ncbi:hypothetical protein KCP70_12120 [Salmonella enterica subsp. enterica]|nr:hypothetical protein KCP70_12120 [Salmonella enterica subsp. enterica]
MREAGVGAVQIWSVLSTRGLFPAINRRSARRSEDKSRAFDGRLAKAQIEEEAMGATTSQEARFDDFDISPLASASIARYAARD